MPLSCIFFSLGVLRSFKEVSKETFTKNVLYILFFRSFTKFQGSIEGNFYEECMISGGGLTQERVVRFEQDGSIKSYQVKGQGLTYTNFLKMSQRK